MQAHLYVLKNCDEVLPYIEEHKYMIQQARVKNVENRHKKQFREWFESHIIQLYDERKVSKQLLDLARGPLEEAQGILLMVNGGSKGGVGTSDANGSRNDLAHQGKKKGRGPTRNLKLAKEFKGGERYEIGWLNRRPVGPHARDLINECSQASTSDKEKESHIPAQTSSKFTRMPAT
nr:hypothetical protein CFP56_38099 [Quercus suber]